MNYYEQITLEEDIMIPKGTQMMGKMLTLDKDITIEKGDRIRMYPSGMITVFSESLRKAVNIIHRQYGEAIWLTAKMAKHSYLSFVPKTRIEK